MYVMPEGRSYKPTQQLYMFTEPKRRHHRMTVAYAEGTEELAVTSRKGLTGYIWRVYVDVDDVFIEREDLGVPTKLFSYPGITQIDLTFDQNARPFVTFMADGKSFYYHFDPQTNSYNYVELPTGSTFPRCELDYRLVDDAPRSDIILAYLRDGVVYYCIQRERYLKEYEVGRDPKKSMLWRIGRCIDGSFGYHWR